MSLWPRFTLLLAWGGLPSSRAGSPGVLLGAFPSVSTVGCGCCACPQPNELAPTRTETKNRCAALTCFHSYGSRADASSGLSAAQKPPVCAAARFAEKFVVRGCAAIGAAIFRAWLARSCARLFSDLQSARFIDTEHQIQVLHGGPGRAFAEVVEPRNDQDLLLVTEDEQLESVRVVTRERTQIAVFQQRFGIERLHDHEALAVIVRGQDLVHVFRGCFFR